ncbi:MAG: VanZ family protein, partial [Acetatifactor sp.]|nr:VanZ family protein [Acetatifactor sp.]
VGLLALTFQGRYQRPAAMVRYAAWRRKIGEKINLVTFHPILGRTVDFSLDDFLVNVVGNIVMFMPWGFGLVLLWKRKQRVFSVVLHSLALPVFIETCQLFIGRWVDVDDLILNFVGGCLGAALYFWVRRLVPDVEKLAR